MSPKKDTQKSAESTTAIGKTSTKFTDEEKARDEGARQRAEGGRARNKDRAAGESDLLAKIAEMPEPERSMAKRLHEIITTSAPSLLPKTWYGMPAYAKDGKVVCFFQAASKFNTRYATFGFQRRCEP